MPAALVEEWINDLSEVNPVLGALALLILGGLAYWMLEDMVKDLFQSGRPCPRCGVRVEAGVLDCEGCGFDFRTIGASDAEEG